MARHPYGISADELGCVCGAVVRRPSEAVGDYHWTEKCPSCGDGTWGTFVEFGPPAPKDVGKATMRLLEQTAAYLDTHHRSEGRVSWDASSGTWLLLRVVPQPEIMRGLHELGWRGWSRVHLTLIGDRELLARASIDGGDQPPLLMNPLDEAIIAAARMTSGSVHAVSMVPKEFGMMASMVAAVELWGEVMP